MIEYQSGQYLDSMHTITQGKDSHLVAYRYILSDIQNKSMIEINDLYNSINTRCTSISDIGTEFLV